MRVREIMSEPVETVPPTMPLVDAGAIMRRQRLHHLIVTEASRVVGMISENELKATPAGAPREGRTVSDLMSRNVATVDENDTVRKTANLMRGRSIGCVAVTRKGRLVGIVTVSDLLDLLGHGGERRVEGLRASLHYRTPHRKHHRTASW